jgi:hypothetical protein
MFQFLLCANDVIPSCQKMHALLIRVQQPIVAILVLHCCASLLFVGGEGVCKILNEKRKPCRDQKVNQGCKTARCLVISATKFCMMGHTIFSSFSLCTKMCIYSHIPTRKCHKTVRFIGHSRIVDYHLEVAFCYPSGG